MEATSISTPVTPTVYEQSPGPRTESILRRLRGTKRCRCGKRGNSFMRAIVYNSKPLVTRMTDELRQEAVEFRKQHHRSRSEEHTSELQSPVHLVCRLL